MADPYRTPGTPETEGLIAELGILRQANAALSLQVDSLRRDLERARRELYARTPRGTTTELVDLLRASLYFVKMAEKFAGRTTGIKEIIAKIEGVPGVKE